MNNSRIKGVLVMCILLFGVGLWNIYGSTDAEITNIYWQDEKVDLPMKDFKVKTADFHAVIGSSQSKEKLTAQEDTDSLEVLCAQSGISYCYDGKNHRILLGANGAYAQQIPVLLYHHILPQSDMNGIFADNALVISAEEFAWQMQYLYENGWKTVGLSDLKKFVIGEKLLPKQSFVITFDDGFLSSYYYAYPILKQYQAQAVMFLISDIITEKEEQMDADLLQYLSWDQVQIMQDVFAYGSHSADMHHLIQGNSELITTSQEDVYTDLSRSQKRINGTGYFSYPYGQYNKKLKEIVKACGYDMAFAVDGASVEPGDDLFCLKRYDVYQYRQQEKFKKIFS